MATPPDALLLEVLKACRQSEPNPLYPAEFAAASGLDRTALDQALDHLRLRGLVRLTDWVRDKGQGCALTSEGAAVLQAPGLLKKAQRASAPQAFSQAPREGADSKWDRGEAVREVLLNPRPAYVCMTMLGLNIIVFAAGMFNAMQDGAGVGAFLGNTAGRVTALLMLDWPDVIYRDQWWRLLSYAFVHGSVLHIAMNMYFLYSFGPLLETMWGSMRFLVLYLIAAVTGGCAVVMVPKVPVVPVVGASGALCGLLASFGVWTYLNRNGLPPHIVSNWMRNVITNLILMAIISTLPGISWEGHLGGAIGGALVSVPLNAHRFGRGLQKMLGILGIVAIPVLAIGLVIFQYNEVLQVRWLLYPAFQRSEARAASVFNEQGLPLFKKWQDDLDKTDVAAARTNFKSAQDELESTLHDFDGAGPFHDPVVGNTVNEARAYLENWAKFYALFTKTVAEPPPWPDEPYRALARQLNEIERARRPLARSPLLPSAYSEIQK